MDNCHFMTQYILILSIIHDNNESQHSAHSTEILHVFGPLYFWGSDPQIFVIFCFFWARFRSCGKVSRRSADREGPAHRYGKNVSTKRRIANVLLSLSVEEFLPARRYVYNIERQRRVCLSVCLSVTAGIVSKRNVMISSPSDSPMISASEKLWPVKKFARGHPQWGRFLRVGWVRTGDFFFDFSTYKPP